MGIRENGGYRGSLGQLTTALSIAGPQIPPLGRYAPSVGMTAECGGKLTIGNGIGIGIGNGK